MYSTESLYRNDIQGMARVENLKYGYSGQIIQAQNLIPT